MTVYWLLVLLLSVALSAALFYAIKFALIIIKVQDATEEALDLLDESYKKINEILQRPLFYDSLEVRQVLREIQRSQDAVLIVANELTSFNSKKDV